MKKFLVLGGGMVVRPLVKYLLGKEDAKVIVATRTVNKAEAMISGFEDKGKAVAWTIDKIDELREMVENSDVIISMLPYKYHVDVARICLEKNKHLITTSYVKPEMQSFDQEARSKKLIFLNELGLDPGIDHMIAMEAIHKIENGNGKVTQFYSYCGALPAPDFSDNPFKYKFSWSPKGVVLAAKNSAKYLKDNKVVELHTEELFSHPFYIDIETIGKLEVYPNRDSLHYIELYGIEGVKDMFRGTLRYPHWSELWTAIKKINILDENKMDTTGLSYRGLIAKLNSLNEADVEEELKNKYNVSDEIIEKLRWVGLFSDKEIPHASSSPIDLFVELLTEKLMLKGNEKDMVVLKNDITAVYDDRKEIHHLTLIDFGSPDTDTSVARTVGIPAAIGAYLVASKVIDVAGVHIPVIPEIYKPILEELDRIGIKIKREIETF